MSRSRALSATRAEQTSKPRTCSPRLPSASSQASAQMTIRKLPCTSMRSFASSTCSTRRTSRLDRAYASSMTSRRKYCRRRLARGKTRSSSQRRTLRCTSARRTRRASRLRKRTKGSSKHRSQTSSKSSPRSMKSPCRKLSNKNPMSSTYSRTSFRSLRPVSATYRTSGRARSNP